MLSFTQINLHKAVQATNVLGLGLQGKSNRIALLTEPYAHGGKITGMPGGTALVYAEQKPNQPPPRAGILASRDVRVTAMEKWCSRDCAVALARIGGKQAVIVSLYLDICL